MTENVWRTMNFVNFEESQLEIIFRALDFAKQAVMGHYNLLAAPVDESLRQPIWDEMERAARPITETMNFFNENKTRRFITMAGDDFSYFMDTIRSALELYREHIEETHRATGIGGYSDLVRRVEEISNLGGPSKGRKDSFLKYYVEEQDTRNKVRIFISYQDKDVEKACEIRKLLISNSSKIAEQCVFVAHRDIPLTEQWRKTMIAQLDNSTHLIALCTENYMCSAFGNQEVGYAMAKNAKIVSIFWEGTQRNRYGFLENLQGLPEYVNETTLEKAVKEILKKLSLC
jgi:hypothetical protein